MALGQVFPPSSSVLPCEFHSTSAPLLGKGQKIIIFIFITGLHNKPHGCSASVASAAGPFTTKKKVLRLHRITTRESFSGAFENTWVLFTLKVYFCVYLPLPKTRIFADTFVCPTTDSAGVLGPLLHH
jgi:hypothetical protein